MLLFSRRYASSVIEEGDPYWENVVLLMGANGANNSFDFVDESLVKNRLRAHGGAHLSTTDSKFGSASMECDVNSQSVIAFDNSDLNMDAEDFTIEFWTRRTSPMPSQTTYMAKWEALALKRQWMLQYISNGELRLYTSTSGSNNVYSYFKLGVDGISIDDFFDGNWHHVAIVRDNGTIKVYVDGLLGSRVQNHGTTPLYANTETDLTICGSRVGSEVLNAVPTNIDDLRITKGVTRYTGPFTPPTEAFTRGPVPPPAPVVTVPEMSVYTILGGSQTAVSAQSVEAYIILGAPQTAVSARAVEMYTIVEV